MEENSKYNFSLNTSLRKPIKEKESVKLKKCILFENKRCHSIFNDKTGIIIHKGGGLIELALNYT
jgi:hypothetical protein